MMVLHPEYLVDGDSQRKAVVLTTTEWELILERMEELDDIRTYDSVKVRKEEAVPLETALHEKSADYFS